MYYITAKVKYNLETDFTTKFLVITPDGAEWKSRRADFFTLDGAKKLVKKMENPNCYYFLADDCSDYRYGKIIIDSIEVKEFKG